LFLIGIHDLEGKMPRLCKHLAAACALLAFGAGSAPEVKAQGFFDEFFTDLGRAFGGGGNSGRTTVRWQGKQTPGSIIVSFGDRRLYYVQGKGTAISYPIAIPKSEARWAGQSYVSMKRENPGWTPTAEMRRENPKLPPFVAGGDPRNPMGVRALYLGSSLYRIHGTDAPWLIGKEVSKGCIRMYNEDVVDLYRRSRVGTPVTVTWQRFAVYS
jgi:lipoprotein-anchoring transpeptidase ErfK/SrfK